MTKQERAPMAEEEINAEIERREQEPFDYKSEAGKIEEYHNAKRGEVLQARREIAETFGLGDDDIERALKLVEDYYKKANTEYTPEEDDELKRFMKREYFKSFSILYRAEQRINKNEHVGTDILNRRAEEERRKKIRAFEEKLGKI